MLPPGNSDDPGPGMDQKPGHRPADSGARTRNHEYPVVKGKWTIQGVMRRSMVNHQAEALCVDTKVKTFVRKIFVEAVIAAARMAFHAFGA